MKIVKFKYCDEFHCAGPKCLETCCQQWSIFFSKRDYLNLKNARCSPELKKSIEKAFVRIKGASDSQLNYAEIKFDDRGYCPMLGDDGLCRIQKELGEKRIGFVCNVFPRRYSLVEDSAIILTLNITCSHVMELLIKHPEGLEIVEEEYAENDKYVNRGVFSNYVILKKWKGYPYFWILKNTAADILQNRRFSVGERLLILGYYSKKSDEYIEEKNGEKISSLSAAMLDNEMCRKIADSLKAPQSDDSAGAKSIDIFFHMMNYLDKTNSCSPAIRQLFTKVKESLGIRVDDCDGNLNIVYNKEAYLKNRELFGKIEAERSYIFENLLVNQILGDSPLYGLFRSYFVLVVSYNMIKICVPALLPEEWDDGDLALTLSRIAKMMINNKLADTETVASFIKNDSFDLPHTAFLIS